MEIKGKVLEISNEQVITEKFKKREFVLQVEKEVSGNVYTDLIQMQTTNAKTSILNELKVNDEVNVHFNIRGSKWTNKEGRVSYITNLEAWKIEVEKSAVNNSAKSIGGPDGLPF